MAEVVAVFLTSRSSLDFILLFIICLTPAFSCAFFFHAFSQVSILQPFQQILFSTSLGPKRFSVISLALQPVLE